MNLFEFSPVEVRPGSLDFDTRVAPFLRSHNLNPGERLERYFCVCKNDEIVAGAGYSDRVIKCAAVAPAYRGEGLLGGLVTRILAAMREDGSHTSSHVFVFTRPENAAQFQTLGFTGVEECDGVLLMELGGSITKYLARLSAHKQMGETAPAGAVVVNCNPFSLGHQHLITKASEQCGTLYVFVVQEDLSAFPFEARLKLVRAGVAHLTNVRVIPGGEYIISAATFPTYFIPDADTAVSAHARLDVKIFAAHICPALDITTRFVGEEPYSRVTNIYNQTMSEILPGYGVGLKIFPRKTFGDDVISASRIRSALAAGKIELTRELVPPTTYEFLQSPDGQDIIARLQSSPDDSDV